MDSNIKVITSAGGFEQSYNWSSGILKNREQSFMLALCGELGDGRLWRILIRMEEI